MQVITDLKDTPGTAIHAYLVIRTLMNWAVGRGLLTTSPVPPWKFKVKPRSRILNDTELKTVWKRAQEGGYPYGTIVKLLILTGQRRGEIAGLRRSWIKDDWITFPEGFTKNKREHRIPIGTLAKEIIDNIPGDTDLLFPARGKPDTPLSNWGKNKREFDKPLTIDDYTLHDLRRTYSSNLAKLGVPIHVTERLLNHMSGTISGVAAVYNRYDYEDEMHSAVLMHEKTTPQFTR
jgi:integrase